MPRTLLFCALAPVILAGCSATAKRPPTPAANLTAEDLDAVPRDPGDRYFLLMFGSEARPKTAAKTHVFATVVRASGGAVVESRAISWLPAVGDIEPWTFRVVPGRNYGLHETLAFCARTRQRVALWGPHEIGHRLYFRFNAQADFLDGGGTRYQSIDAVGEAHRGLGCNCIHAVSDMDPVYGRDNYPLIFFGQAAARRLDRRILESSAAVDPGTTHAWVAEALGLSGYALERPAR